MKCKDEKALSKTRASRRGKTGCASAILHNWAYRVCRRQKMLRGNNLGITMGNVKRFCSSYLGGSGTT
jgi:hypothetical protein